MRPTTANHEFAEVVLRHLNRTLSGAPGERADFLLRRAQCGVADPELAKWWTEIQVLPHEERVALVQARPAEPSAEGDNAPAPGRRRRRRRRGGAART